MRFDPKLRSVEASSIWHPIHQKVFMIFVDSSMASREELGETHSMLSLRLHLLSYISHADMAI